MMLKTSPLCNQPQGAKFNRVRKLIQYLVALISRKHKLTPRLDSSHLAPARTTVVTAGPFCSAFGTGLFIRKPDDYEPHQFNSPYL